MNTTTFERKCIRCHADIAAPQQAFFPDEGPSIVREWSICERCHGKVDGAELEGLRATIERVASEERAAQNGKGTAQTVVAFEEAAELLEKTRATALKANQRSACYQFSNKQKAIKLAGVDRELALLPTIDREYHQEAAASGNVCEDCGWNGEGIRPSDEEFE